MPSSISNSNSRIPKISYKRELVLAALITVFLLVAAELTFRWQGHDTSVSDTMQFWALHRDNVYDTDGKKRIVLVGSSRAHIGLVPSVMEEKLPDYQVVQLSVAGSSAYEIISNLVKDPDFDGILVWGAFVQNMFPLSPGSERKDLIYAKFYEDEFSKHIRLDKRLNISLGAALQDSLVFLSPHVDLKQLLEQGIGKGRLLPKPNYVTMNYDRFRPARYHEMITPERLVEHRKIRIQDRADSVEIIDLETFNYHVQTNLKEFNDRIKAKGGKLILVRMPTTGEYWELDQLGASKEKFWDQINHLSGIPTLHFRDHAELNAFDCPDGSHLDYPDAQEFSRRISDHLRRMIDVSTSEEQSNKPNED